MKKIKYIFILMIGFQASANDLIFKNGFENRASISGNVTGLSSTGMVIMLNLGGDVSEELVINNNGGFFFALDLFIGETWKVGISKLPFSPNQQSCAIINNVGSAPEGGFDGVQVICDDTAWRWDEMSWDQGGWQ